MTYIESISCVRFVPRTSEETYLEFDRACTSSGEVIESCGSCTCFSGAYVDSTRGLAEGGRVRLVTGSVTLRPGYFMSRGLITHELLHVLGHHHTQKRPDRDSYITINDNTSPYQFSKCTYCDTLNVAYDCMSIMHYRDWAFMINKDTPSIVAKDPATCDVKSDNEFLRWADIDLLNTQYQCTGSIPTSSGTGTVQSHSGYGNTNYDNYGYVSEYIKVAEGNTIEFTFAGEYGIENHSTCRYDYVKIIDGNGIDILAKSCGATAPSGTLTSTTNRATIEFVADSTENDKGFQVTWREVGDATEPPTTVTEPPTTAAPVEYMSGTLSSPRYPSKYPNQLNERYSILVEEGRIVEIEFVVFKVRASRNCKKDFVTITDGNGEILLNKACGITIPEVEIVSKTNQVYVDFVTNGRGREQGWTLNWNSIASAPEPQLLSSPGYPGNYTNNLNETYTITAPMEDQQIEISFTHFAIEGEADCMYDTLRIVDADGTVLLPPSCGYLEPAPVMSRTNQVKVIFTTDMSVVDTGFELEWRVVMT